MLVRHAHASARKEWSGDDRLRPLSANGLRQAEGLIAVFGNFARPSRVLSSPYLRCMQTVDALAHAHHLEVEPEEDLAEGQSSNAIDLVRALAKDNVAVCTHGDVIAEYPGGAGRRGHAGPRAKPAPSQGFGVGA